MTPALRPAGGVHGLSSMQTPFGGRSSVIADDLHCDAVRITGGDPERLAVAAEHAADAGLEVWFSPFPCELPATDLLPYFADCADRAQDGGGRRLSSPGAS